jgi:beta-phosphoglucomutase-like phosphatase (HAD superfamily)
MKDVTRGKPAPDTFLLAAKNLNLKPKNCVVIEDSLAGLEAAIAAKMTVIALTTTRRRDELTAADMIVSGLYELRAKDFVAILKAQAA